jgi:hypothetical protein
MVSLRLSSLPRSPLWPVQLLDSTGGFLDVTLRKRIHCHLLLGGCGHGEFTSFPVWLEGIIRKLHAKEPAQRFQCGTEVADLLEQCLAHVQQPDQRPLPPLAEELGRQVAGRGSSWRVWHWRARPAKGSSNGR